MDNKKIRNSALLVVAMGSFLIPFMGSSLSIALPLIGKDDAVATTGRDAEHERYGGRQAKSESGHELSG